MKVFYNNAGKQVTVTEQLLRVCLQDAITSFNLYDSESLLLPRRSQNGHFVGENERGWGGASERSISHRLAVYLEEELRKKEIVEQRGIISVDCEYNRHSNGIKQQRVPRHLLATVEKARRKVKRISDDSGYYVISIAPDIIVHRRGEDVYNLLVVEMKKKSNIEIPGYDEGKLICFTKRGPDDYGYELGFSVIAIDDVALDERRLELSTPYANGKPQDVNYAA